ncbi:MAG: CDP-glycerol glycerophosphotransferase family protein [Candidatus Electryonea clarkiae]|nr:CDP-glycerol glycerophosphotransferase family protein [Candidatus Electryonea clarkiae]MDP8287670.1 CDP-glycerol glycerophosphotransferase family protein [Candidatus Electryonea clarkiae]
MKILFYAKRNLHLPHLEPVRKWISDNRPEIDVIYSSPPFQESMNGMPGIGLEDFHIQALIAKGLDWIPLNEITTWEPDITIMADADFGEVLWGGKIVNVNHGLICKGTFYTHAATVQRENRADMICVPGQYHADILSKVIHSPVFATGLTKFDPIGRGELTKNSARAEFGFNPGDRVVLFAPTYNLELSAVPVVTDRIRDLTADGTKVIIKLHGMAPLEWVELYDLLSLLEENIIHVRDQDITPSLVAADVVISDVSSAFMEAMALDRPVVLVNNPLQQLFHSYDPSDIEYKWRDVGIEVSTPEQMINAVKRSFDYPDEKAERRQSYGSQLVGTIDGKAAERVALCALSVIETVLQ